MSTEHRTYRERREAKAERLREWADKREAKQSALDQAADPTEAGTGIPFGQPILVGHHSERRHRRAIERVDRAMAASVENAQKARDMRSRADNIEQQANGAIYSDDEDAVERLQEKLAGLEQRREAMKAANATYRKEHHAELKAMSAYERYQSVPFPGYSLQNLGGVISTTRQRIERLSRPVEAERGRWLVARYKGECRKCEASIDRGERVMYFKRSKAVECETCAA